MFQQYYVLVYLAIVFFFLREEGQERIHKGTSATTVQGSIGKELKKIGSKKNMNAPCNQVSLTLLVFMGKKS